MLGILLTTGQGIKERGGGKERGEGEKFCYPYMARSKKLFVSGATVTK